MTIKQKYTLKRRFINFFGGLGYFVCCILWLTMVVVYTGFIKDVLLPLVSKPTPVSEAPPPAPVVIDLASNPPLMVLGVIITFTITILALYVFIRIPKTLVKTSKQIVHETAETVAPVVMRMQHVEAPERHPIKLKRTKTNIIIAVKAVLVIIPLTLVLCSGLAHQTSLDIGLSSMIGAWLAGLSILFFVIQYTLAKLLSLKQQDIL